jgi:hypothetical protein
MSWWLRHIAHPPIAIFTSGSSLVSRGLPQWHLARVHGPRLDVVSSFGACFSAVHDSTLHVSIISYHDFHITKVLKVLQQNLAKAQPPLKFL